VIISANGSAKDNDNGDVDLHDLPLPALLERANEVGVDQVALDKVDDKNDIIALSSGEIHALLTRCPTA